MRQYLTVFCLLFLCATGQAQANQYAAVVMGTEGPQAEYAVGTLAGTKIELMEFVTPSETIFVPQNGSLTLHFFASSTQEIITGPAKIIVEKQQSRQLEGQTIQRTKVDCMPMGAGNTIAQSQVVNFGTVSFRKPLGVHGAVLRFSVQPAAKLNLKWKAITDTDRYIVTYGDKNAACQENETQGLQWPIPASSLTTGAHKTWKVAALKAGKTQNLMAGEIDILSDAQLQEFNKDKKLIFQTYPQESVERQTMLLGLFIANNMSLDATNILKKLLKKYPNNTSFARMFKNQQSKSAGINIR